MTVVLVLSFVGAVACTKWRSCPGQECPCSLRPTARITLCILLSPPGQTQGL